MPGWTGTHDWRKRIIDFLAELTSGMATSIGVASKAVTGQMALCRGHWHCQKPAFIAGRGIKAAYLVVQTFILGLARAYCGRWKPF